METKVKKGDSGNLGTKTPSGSRIEKKGQYTKIPPCRNLIKAK